MIFIGEDGADPGLCNGESRLVSRRSSKDFARDTILAGTGSCCRLEDALATDGDVDAAARC